MKQRDSTRLRAAAALVIAGTSTMLSACGLVLGFDEFERVERDRPGETFTTSGQGGGGGDTPAVTSGGGMGGTAGMGGTGEMQLPNGNPCTAPGECESGFCVDGVCCDTACDQTCQACSAATKASADSDGVCGDAAAGQDPHDDCNDDGATSCNQDGNCDGMGACRIYPSMTPCGAMAGCANGIGTFPDQCDGSGNCVDGGTIICSPYVCDAAGAMCLVTCSDSNDCLGTHYCLSGTCVMDKPNGQVCAGAAECQSGFCVDGFCCNTACNATCQACSNAKKGSGSNGTCGNIAVNIDPDNECPGATQSAQCTTGTCNGMGACGTLAAGTSCGQGGTCNSSGQCSSGANGDPCAADDECMSGMCYGSVCVASVNGCDVATAIDMTGMSGATVDFGGASGNNYVPKCIKVSETAVVTFNGSFSGHPLQGGVVENGMLMPASSGPFINVTNTGNTASFTMSSAGTYPYYCTFHALGGMTGAVFVVP